MKNPPMENASMEALSVTVFLAFGSLVGVGISAAGLKLLLTLMPSKQHSGVGDSQRA